MHLCCIEGLLGVYLKIPYRRTLIEVKYYSKFREKQKRLFYARELL